MTVAIVLFLVTYALLLILPNYRAYVALGSAALYVILGILPASSVLGAVDWNVIMMIAGTMGVVYLFIESDMPSLLADLLIEKTPNVKWAMVALALFAGLISAFVDNVATVLMVVPVAITISKKLEISPVPSVIAIAISSNLQGAATLVGDTTSILLGSYADMNFFDFFIYRGRPGLFWVVQAAALSSALVLLYLFRKDTEPVEANDRTVVADYFPTVLLVGMVVLLIVASFVPHGIANINGYICIGAMLLGIIRSCLLNRNLNTLKEVMFDIDYFTLLLLAGLFVVIAGITQAGVVDKISEVFVSVSGDNLFVIYTVVVWASVLFSAFIDNIPYVATMLPVVQGISNLLAIDPTLLYFGLLVGATLGGNLTPIGASANITALGMLRREGHEVNASTFMKISVPFTLVAVTTGYLMVWFIWA